MVRGGAKLQGVTQAMGQRDEIGTRGEAIFTTAIMDFCGRDRPYFVPHFLGDKFRTLDFIVELVGCEEGSPYLFVQVKTTRQGYSKSKAGTKLKVGMNEEDVIRMRDYPAPTYLVGIDEGSGGAISGMTTRYGLDGPNLKILWDEVNSYWQQRDMKVKKSAFST